MDTRVYLAADEWANELDELTEISQVLIELSERPHSTSALVFALREAAVREAEMWKELQAAGNFADRDTAQSAVWAERQKRNHV